MRKKFLIVLAVIPFLFGFGITNVNADIRIENDAYVIDFNDDNYNENDFYLIFDLGEQLIDFFEVEYNTQKTITNTNFIDTNLNDLEIVIFNYYYDDFESATLIGFTLNAYNENNDFVGSSFVLMNEMPFVDGDIGDYYINFDFLNPPPPPPEYVFTKLFDFIFKPLDILFQHIGISEQTISIGFGNIEWFNLEIVLVLKLILAVLIVWLFTKFIYWFFRNIFNMITGWLK